MSKEFDLEPPKAPTEKKEKKSLFSRLFNSKKELDLDPEMPIPQKEDVSILREQLGITPKKSSFLDAHYDILEKNANVSSLDEANQYDLEQSLDSQELDFPSRKKVHIDPSLVEESNKDLARDQDDLDFKVDDFSQEFDDSISSKEESPFAQEIIPKMDSPLETNKESSFSKDLSLNEKPFQEKDEEKIENNLSNFLTEEMSSSLLEKESPFAQEEFMQTPFQEEKPSSLGSSFAEDTDGLFEARSHKKESPFAQEFDDRIIGSLDEEEKQSLESDVLETHLEEPSSSKVKLPQALDSKSLPEFLPEVIKKVSEQKMLTYLVSDVATKHIHEPLKKILNDSIKKVIKKHAKKSSSKKEEKVIPLSEEKVPFIVVPEEIITAEKKAQLNSEAKDIAHKQFQKYVLKEEKITVSFLKKEALLDAYIQSEKENFLKFSSMIKTTSIVNELIIDADILKEKLDSFENQRITYEEKLHHLYAKKYDLFSSWLQSQTKLLKENLTSFEKIVALKTEKLISKQNKINIIRKEIVAKLVLQGKKYSSLSKKLLQLENKLTKKQLEYEKLEEKHSKKIEKLLDREIRISSQEKEIEKKRKSFDKELLSLEKKIENKKIEFEKEEEKIVSKKSETIVLQKTIDQVKEHLSNHKKSLKSKEKTIFLLDKTISDKESFVNDKEEELLSLEKQKQNVLLDQEKSQELLDKRELAVLDKININEKHLRNIQAKKQALIELEKKIEQEGFRSYINAKLDQISPEEDFLSGESENLDDSLQLGSKMNVLMHSCKQAIDAENFDQAKKIYAQIRDEYVQLEIPREEKALLYAKVRELYNDINLKILEVRSEVRSKDIIV